MGEEVPRMQNQEPHKQKLIMARTAYDLTKRVNAQLDSGYWRIVPGSIGCGDAARTFQVIGGEKTEIEAHFWAVIEQRWPSE